jgi:hypothetical protein
MMNRFLILLLTCLFAGAIPPTDKSLVTVSVNESVVYIGMNTIIAISVEVAKGYHIQVNKVNDESLIPTTLEVKEVRGITISRQQFPPGKKFKLEGSDSFLNVYDGKFLIKLFISPGTELQPGNYILGAKLRYQACDSRTCLFPRVIDFSIPVIVYPQRKVGSSSQ